MLEDILVAVRGIRAIKGFPRNLSPEHLDEADSAAFNVCTAIIEYITIVIRSFNRGKAGECNHCLVLLTSVLETALTALTQGERAFTEGQLKIQRAVTVYDGIIQSLTTSMICKAERGIQNMRFGG